MTQEEIDQIEQPADFEELDERVYPDGYEDPNYEVTGCDGDDE